MIRQIVFTGHVKAHSGIVAVQEDAQVAIAQCANLGLTGLTLYNDGSFISALEGDADALEQVLTFYQIDTRLGDVKAIIDATRPARDFPDYRMGFRREDFVASIDQTFRLNAASLRDAFAPVTDGEAKILLRTFGRVNGILSAV
jgi:hypothetical protein